jgi:hypothetical protein
MAGTLATQHKHTYGIRSDRMPYGETGLSSLPAAVVALSGPDVVAWHTYVTTKLEPSNAARTV